MRPRKFRLFSHVLMASLVLLSSAAKAREIEIKGELHDRESIKIVEVKSEDGRFENDRISYQWCVYQEGCVPLGKAEGFTRVELTQKYENLRAVAAPVQTTRTAAKGVGGSLLVVFGLGVAFAASPVGFAAVLIGLGVGGNAAIDSMTGRPIKMADSISPETFQRDVTIVGHESNFGGNKPIYVFRDTLLEALGN